VTCTRPALVSGATAPDIDVTVTAPNSAGTITNTATVSAAENDPTPVDNSDSEDTTVQAPPPPPAADLSITKTDSVDPVTTGADFSYTLSVANAGPSDASSVSVSDQLPAGTSFVSASGTGWTCGNVSGTVTCTRPALVSGATAPDIDVTVTAPNSAGTITNTATVSAAENDPTPVDNSDSEDTTVQAPPPPPAADLSITKTDSVDPVTTGADFSYTLSVANAGPSDASSVSVSDQLPAGTSFVSASGTGWTCGNVSGTVTCTRPALVSGANAPDITVMVTAPGSAGTITNTATVSAAENDPTPANNSDSEDTTVQAVKAGGAQAPGDNSDVEGNTVQEVPTSPLALTGIATGLFLLIGSLLVAAGSLMTYFSRRNKGQLIR
jgi:uncharacterized repeat protein (TIGR01451 family)